MLKSQFVTIIKAFCNAKHKHTLGLNENSYKSLSKLSNIPVTTIQNWLNDKTEPSLRNAQLLLSAIGYTLEIRRIENETN